MPGDLSSIIANFNPFAMGGSFGNLAGFGGGGASGAAGGVPSNLSGALSSLGVPNADAVSSAVSGLAGGVPANLQSAISGLASSYGVPAQYLPSASS